MSDTDLMIEGHTAIWSIPPGTQGDIGGTYSGQFKFKTYLSPMQMLAANKEYREMLGANASSASEHDGYLAYALTQLKYRVISSPPFWTTPQQNGAMAGSIPDENVILAVLDAAVRAETVFKAKMASERDSVLKRTITIAEEMLTKEQGEE